jgi:branched-chain amino acid transport system permease protein
MELFVQNLVKALALGGTYALLALGLALIFSILRLINFAHGELVTITGYVLFFSLGAGLATPIIVVLGILAAGVASTAVERVFFRPFRGADPTTMLLTTFGLSIAIQVLLQVIISPRPKGVNIDLGVPGVIHLGGIQVGGLQFVSLIASLCALTALTVFIRGTNMGLSMRAAAENLPVARLMGVRANGVIATAFLVSGLLAGLAGVLWVAQRATVDPLMSLTPLLKAFVAAIVGGLGSPVGAAGAAFLLGILEVGFQSYLPGGLLEYRDALVWVVVIGVLVFRPNGLFRPAGEKV